VSFLANESDLAYTIVLFLLPPAVFSVRSGAFFYVK